MNSEAATKAIFSHFTSGWLAHSTTKNYPMSYPNVQPTTDYSQGTVPWVRISILPLSGNRITIGTSRPRYRFSGEVKIGIFTPIKTGSLIADKIADVVCNIFIDNTLNYTTGNIIFRVPLIKMGFADEYGWWCLPVSCPFDRNEQKT
jgi:hypothetical protein